MPAVLERPVTGGNTRNFDGIADMLNRASALSLLEDIQQQSVRNGTDTLTMDEINAEIAAYRQERRRV
jgi:hypothetical protein